MDLLYAELSDVLDRPLRIGIGLHVGEAVVGSVSSAEAGSLQFLGDTGNVAAKLESETKRLDCTFIASTEALSFLTRNLEGIETQTVSIPGRDATVRVAIFKDKVALQNVLAGM